VALDIGTPIAVGHDADVAARRLEHPKVIRTAGVLKSDIERLSGSGIDVRVISALAGTVAIALGSRFNGHGCRLLGEGSSTNAAYAIERALMEYE
jgi:hypothetical protein